MQHPKSDLSRSSRLRKNSVSRRFREGPEFQWLRKKLRLAPVLGRARVPVVAQKLRLAPVSGGARVPVVAQKTPSRAGFGKGPSSSGCAKTPARAGFWEGHEFHSCRIRRPLNSGFQPLGECCPSRGLFSRSLLSPLCRALYRVSIPNPIIAVTSTGSFPRNAGRNFQLCRAT